MMLFKRPTQHELHKAAAQLQNKRSTPVDVDVMVEAGLKGCRVCLLCRWQAQINTQL